MSSVFPMGAPPNDQPVNQTDQLIHLGFNEFKLYVSDHGEPFAVQRRASSHEALLLERERRFEEELSALYYEKHKRAPAPHAVKTAVLSIAAEARKRDIRKPVHRRVAMVDDRVFVDQCDKAGTVLKIRPDGCDVCCDAPAYFRRSQHALTFEAEIASTGNLEHLWNFIPVQSKADRALIIAWLTKALMPGTPTPILVLYGEHGSAKSTTARVLRQLVDPSSYVLQALPRTERDLIAATANGYVLACDNVSHVSQALSDTLCQVSTRGGAAARALYTDTDQVAVSFENPLILNGIEPFVTRADLLDRAILVELEPIPEEDRRSEGDLYEAFDREAPFLRGQLLSLVSAALGNLRTVPDRGLPRMADFARVGIAIEERLGLPSGGFLAAYRANRRHAREEALDSSPIWPSLVALLEHEGSWIGRPKDLLGALEGYAGKDGPKRPVWPKTSEALTSHLKRLAPNMRAAGVIHRQLPRKFDGARLSLHLETSGGDDGDGPDADPPAPPPHVGSVGSVGRSHSSSASLNADNTNRDRPVVTSARDSTITALQDWGRDHLWPRLEISEDLTIASGERSWGRFLASDDFSALETALSYAQQQTDTRKNSNGTSPRGPHR